MPVGHVGHWIWDLLALAPVLLIGIALLVAHLMHRPNPERYRREEEEAAERELDEILNG